MGHKFTFTFKFLCSLSQNLFKFLTEKGKNIIARRKKNSGFSEEGITCSCQIYLNTSSLEEGNGKFSLLLLPTGITWDSTSQGAVTTPSLASSDMGAVGAGVCKLVCIPVHVNCKINNRTGCAFELTYYDCSSHYRLEFAGLTAEFSHMLQIRWLM